MPGSMVDNTGWVAQDVLADWKLWNTLNTRITNIIITIGATSSGCMFGDNTGPPSSERCEGPSLPYISYADISRIRKQYNIYSTRVLDRNIGQSNSRLLQCICWEVQTSETNLRSRWNNDRFGQGENTGQVHSNYEIGLDGQAIEVVRIDKKWRCYVTLFEKKNLCINMGVNEINANVATDGSGVSRREEKNIVGSQQSLIDLIHNGSATTSSTPVVMSIISNLVTGQWRAISVGEVIHSAGTYISKTIPSKRKAS